MTSMKTVEGKLKSDLNERVWRDSSLFRDVLSKFLEGKVLGVYCRDNSKKV